MPRRSIDDETAARVKGLAHRPPETRETTKDRSWETAQRRDPETTQVAYRGIPRTLNDRMKEIASDQGVSVSQVARLFLECGLAGYENGATLAELAENPGELFRADR